MRRLAFALFASLSTAVSAQTPQVIADIAPVQGLVAQVMQGVAAPNLIIPPGASPHSYAMRPSEARNLAAADLVVWVGPVLTGWLAEPINTLAGKAQHLALQDVPGTLVLENRQGVAFEAHDHDHDHEDAVDVSDDHAEQGDGGDGADPAPVGADPHMWLDPVNASLWLGGIADALAQVDPENAELYRGNAARAQADLAALQATLIARLAPVAGTPFAVFHDAFHYFEARFGVEARAAIALGDGTTPSAARLAEVRQVIADTGAVCVFTEPQFNSGLITALQPRSRPLKSAPLDPLGAALAPDEAFYPRLLTGMADAFIGCLAQ